MTPYPAGSCKCASTRQTTEIMGYNALPFLIFCVFLAGCSTPPTQPTPQPQVIGARPSIPSTTTASTEPQRPTYRGPWEDPSNPLYHRTIYFDYNSAEIKPEYQELLRIHSAYLGKTPTQRVNLDGHTDERGTREYNLALGDRRAESVRQIMLAEGVGVDQVGTLSYGEEKPDNPDHSENAWRLNRRVIIQY